MRRSTIIACTTLAIATSAAAIEPGQWSSSTRMTDIGLPDTMPADVANMVRQQMGDRVMTSNRCITQEEIDNAPQRMFDETQGQCEYSRFDMSGGTISAAARCDTEQGTMEMAMSGTYTDNTYALTMDMTAESPMGSMSFTSQVEGERVGPCTG